MPTSNYVDKIKQDGTSYDIHDTELRNSKGQANGIASLDATGKVPSSQLPDSTDSKVTQTATTTDANYEILFSETADNTTRTEGAGKAATLRFNPSTGSLMEGSNTVASETNSHAEGISTTASGRYSHVEGYYTCASGAVSHAEGNCTTAQGPSSHAEGAYTLASGNNAHAEGSGTTANDDYTHAEGYHTSAFGLSSHAEGYSSIATHNYTHAEGFYTCASGINSHAEGEGSVTSERAAHAEGLESTASGIASHSEGYRGLASGNGAHAEGGYASAGDYLGTFATGENSHAEGYLTTASGKNSHAEGNYTCANGIDSHAEGTRTKANSTDSHAEGSYTYANGTDSHAEGYRTSALAYASHAEGYATSASGSYSHAEGSYNSASGKNSHAEGNYTCANGTDSHAEGYQTRANSADSHAEGSYTCTSGTSAHAEGYDTIASGKYSHAAGEGTCAAGQAQTVVGKFNIADTTSLFIIGNGTSSARSNALLVASDGTTTLGASGSIASGNSQAVTGGAVYTALGNKLDASLKGAANGVAELGSDGKVPSAQLPTIPAAQIQSDYAQNDNTKLDYIKNKPTLGTAAAKDVPSSGNASTTEVVMGNDTRLTDSRNAKDVYSWAKASTKPSYTASEVGAIATSAKGAANGVAELDSTGKVPSSQLPSFVDDVIEVDDYAHLPITGESGKIYVTKDTNKTYRWSGTAYVEISESLALGNTHSTAFYGDWGKTAYDHATETRLTTATASGLYKVASTAQGHIASLTAVTKADITALGIPGSDTNTTYSLTQDSSDGHKIILTPSSGSAQTITIPDNDSKVTSSANHYTPATASGQDKSASASGATAAWSIDVVKGVTLNTDGKGHVTGISVTSGKIPGNPNTDRYVNSAAFADDTTNNANSPVKMTLTRAGSDTQTVTANIPKVSSSGAGVVPKGAAVSSQSQSTKFLREDGTWAAPSYTTNSDTKVTQNASSDNADYRLIFSNTADDTNRTETAKKSTNLTFNPYYAKLNLKGVGRSWIDTGKLPQIYASKPSTDGATGILGIDTKDGRIVLGTYPTSNNYLYFSYFTNITLAGSENKTDKQMYWEADDDDLHVTKINNATVGNSPKFTDTTYSLTQDTSDGHKITLTPSSGTAQTITIPDNNTWRPVQNNLTSDSTTDSLSAAQGKALANGSARDSTKLPLAGGTMTGDIIFNKTGATDLTQVQMRCGANDYGRIAAGGTSNAGYLEIATADDGNEPIYARQYSGVYTSLQRTATILDGSGNTEFPKKLTSKIINNFKTGTGYPAEDKGSSANPRYFPARWSFNFGQNPSDGDVIYVKLPCAGHDWGDFISIDNGTTYKPVAVWGQGTSRLSTHYGINSYMEFVYDATGQVNDIFPAAGGNARSNISGGCWRVINFYDTNTYDRNVFGWTNIKAWGTALTAGNIIVGINGVFHHLKEGTAFDITYPILYLNAGVAANGTQSNVYDCINFTITTTQSITLTQFLPVYIKGTLSGTIFTPVSTTPLTQTVPTSEDGYYYIELGIASSTTAVYLEHRHKIFSYRHNSFSEIVRNATFTTLLKPIAANTSTGISNWNIPSGSYQVWGQRFSDDRLKYTPSGGSETTVTDTGDWTMWLTGNGTSNTATLNMRIDGTFFATTFNGNLSGNASTATSATKATQDSDGNAINTTYLKKSGGTMTGSLSCTTSGANLTWGNITIYGNGSNGGKNSIYIGDDVFIGDCNVGGCFGMRPSNSSTTSVGFRFFSNDGTTSLGGFQSTNGTPQWLDTSGAFHNIGFYTATATSGQVLVADGTGGGLKTSGYTIAKSVPSDADFGNTKNTAGSTDTSSKIFLIGATSQAANPQTYSDNEVYATSGVLTTKSVQVGGTAATMQYNSTNKCIDFVFA